MRVVIVDGAPPPPPHAMVPPTALAIPPSRNPPRRLSVPRLPPPDPSAAPYGAIPPGVLQSGKTGAFAQTRSLCSIPLAGPDSWSKSLLTDGVAERFLPLDMNESESVLTRLVEQLRDLQSEGLQVDGVCTFCEVAVPLVRSRVPAQALPAAGPW